VEVDEMKIALNKTQQVTQRIAQ